MTDFEVVELSVPSVRDYLRWLGEYPDIMTGWGDLKDVQRPWAIEKVLELLPHGGRVLDLGGSRCEVAALLASSGPGYDVTVVDPYDGSGNGPDDADFYRRRHPELTIVEGIVSAATPHPGFDAVISTSVIEHIPIPALQDTVDGIRGSLKPGGFSIHAIDLTCRAVNDFLMTQTELNATWLTAHSIDADVPSIQQAALGDVETYFLPLTAWQRWLKDRTLEEYPWRNVTSLNSVLRFRP